ncbi:Na+/H+ antiporter NhaC family protein [Myxococcota bacterium]
MDDPSEQSGHLRFRLGRASSALPIVFFVGWAITICVAGAPDTKGLILGAVMGLVVGMFLTRDKWSAYAQEIFRGMSDPVGVVAIVAWFWAGMFAQVLQVGGLVKGLAWLGGLAGVTGGGFVGATFILAALFSTAVGTGYGTTVAFCTLMVPSGILLGADPVLLFAAVLSGAAFGDNLAPVSDTTIVSATTQETDVPGVVRTRVKYAIVAAVPAFCLFLVLGGGEGVADPSAARALLEANTDPRGLILLIPFALVVFLALRGHHLLTSLTWGILVAIALISVAGLAPGSEILAIDPEKDRVSGALVDGITGYVEMAALILLIVACSHIMRAGGAMDGLVTWLLQRSGKSVSRAETSSWLIVFALNVFITINTAAEIAAAPFVRRLGKAFGIHPYRRANMLDATTSALGYIFPWSGGVLIGYQTLQNLGSTYSFVEPVEPTRVWPWVFHGWLLAAVMLGAAVTGFGRIYEGADGKPTRARRLPPD